jgi:hypothetical protein
LKRLDWYRRLLLFLNRSAARCCVAGLIFLTAVTDQAIAQSDFDVNGGLNSDGGAMSGPDINRVSGTNSNGTPRQQSAGSSMTNGAGNSYMSRGLTGNTNRTHSFRMQTAPMTKQLELGNNNY